MKKNIKKLLLLFLLPFILGSSCEVQDSYYNTNSSQPRAVNQEVIDKKVDTNVSTIINIDNTNTLENQNQNTTVSNPTPLEPIDYYKNTAGNTVQSPTLYDSRPAGASALCHDGTYSFSQSRRGTCSHHGGVAEWY